MPVEPAEATQSQQPLERDHAQGEERRVQPRYVVALGREVDVAIRMLPAETLGVQPLEEEPRDDVHRAEARPEVP